MSITILKKSHPNLSLEDKQKLDIILSSNKVLNKKVEDISIGDFSINNKIGQFSGLDGFLDENNINSDLPNLDNGSIVFLLESPHIQEFLKTYSNFYLPARAKNGTGGNIMEYLESYKFKVDNIKTKKMPAIFCNPIQYQASLGSFDSKNAVADLDVFRTFNWYSMWLNAPFRENFYQRLETYNPKIIINACTLGSYNFGILDETFEGKELSLDLINIIGEEMQKNGLDISSSQKEINGIIGIQNFSKNRKYVSIREIITKSIKNKFTNLPIYELSHPSSSWFIKKSNSTIFPVN